MDEKVLSEKQAYMAMFYYLEDLFDNQGLDELGGVLGSMSLLDDGKPADPAIVDDWKRAVNKAIESW